MNFAQFKDALIGQHPGFDGSVRYNVSFVYSNVDRPSTYSISCGEDLKLAQRLQRAALAGKVVELQAPIKSDVNGKTYADHGCKVLGRHLNADLKRLGF